MPRPSWTQVALKELRAYFLSPVAYIVIAIFLVVTGWFLFSVFFLHNRADLRDFFSLLPYTLSFVIPAVTMRLFSEEFSSGSYEVLTTLPVTRWGVLAGKYLASVVFVLVMLLPTLSYVLFTAFLGPLDAGPVVGGYVGAVLFGASYCAVGILASSLSRNQIVAYILAVAICFFLTIIDQVLVLVPSALTGVLQYLGAAYHFENIAKGILDSRDLVYFLSLSFAALYATHRVLEAKQ